MSDYDHRVNTPAIEHLDDALIDRHAARLIAVAGQPGRDRYVLGIAGIPGSGKSTLAERLARCIGALAPHPDFARLIPMDGFHLPNAVLESRGLREMKGSPETFDGDGYIALLERLRDPHLTASFPIYDRSRHEPATTGLNEHTVSAATRLIITEGNYLLLDIAPWDRIAPLLDETWSLDADPAIARERLIARHERGGRSAADARRHYERCDARNTAVVLDRSKPARRIIRPVAPPEESQ